MVMHFETPCLRSEIAANTTLDLEELLVYFLDLKSILNPASDVLLDHQSRKLIAVYQDNALA